MDWKKLFFKYIDKEIAELKSENEFNPFMCRLFDLCTDEEKTEIMNHINDKFDEIVTRYK